MPMLELGDATLHYRTHGEGPPVLGIMGFALDQRFWAAQMPVVTQANTFITFDHRAIGRSSGPAATTIDQMADDAYRLLHELGYERAIVFGVSMGGAIAQRLVLDHPEVASGLILAMTFARPLEFMRRQDRLGRMIAEYGGPRELAEAALLRLFTPRFFEIGEEAIDRLLRSLDAPGGPEMATSETLTTQIDALDKHDALADLASISCPTLVIGGKLDIMVPGFASEEIAAAIPGAELHMLETGHGAMYEEMDTFNGIVADFLARLRA